MDNGKKAFRELWEWLLEMRNITAYRDNTWAAQIVNEGCEKARELEVKYLGGEED